MNTYKYSELLEKDESVIEKMLNELKLIQHYEFHQKKAVERCSLEYACSSKEEAVEACFFVDVDCCCELNPYLIKVNMRALKNYSETSKEFTHVKESSPDFLTEFYEKAAELCDDVEVIFCDYEEEFCDVEENFYDFEVSFSITSVFHDEETYSALLKVGTGDFFGKNKEELSREFKKLLISFVASKQRLDGPIFAEERDGVWMRENPNDSEIEGRREYGDYLMFLEFERDEHENLD